jgi:hypothetical protein
MLEDDSVGQVDDDIPIPGDGEGIGRVKHPRWRRYAIALAQKLNGSCAKGGPMARMLGVPIRLSQRVTD